MDFDTTRLRSFLHVAEVGTVAAAAAALGFTGPAVSQHIAKLEAQLGVPLFERAAGRLSLSVHGIALVGIATEVIELADAAAKHVSAPKTGRRVAVAGFASAIRTIVLPTMALFGDVEWDVQDAEDDDALRALRLGSVDIALIQEYDNHPEPRSKRFQYTKLASDRLRLVAPPGNSRAVTLREVASSGWLVNGSGTRCETAAQAILARAGLAPRVVGRVGDTATLLALVAAGHGATIAPERMLIESTAKVVVSTCSLGVTRKIYAIQRKATQSITRDIVTALRITAK